MLHLQALTLLLSALTVAAHPGEDHHAEAEERAAALSAVGQRSLSHCAEKLAARGVHMRNTLRRRAMHNELALGAAHRRDLASVVATSHHSNLTGITAQTESSTLFTGQNQCMLAPETTQGPYYVTGEYFRQNVSESQPGVPLYVDIQIIDTNTCEPLPNVALDFWHCNSTGVYSGIVANGNGDSSDATNLNNTFLRGIQATDADGVAQFLTVFPGHYSGRATHVHVLAHTEGHWSKLENGTITGGETSAHVGQIFFDQDLIAQVEATAPYSTNTQQLTKNADDNIMSGEAANIDPVVEYVLLGNTIEEGIFSWISIGINATAVNTVGAAATYGANGGVANANAMGGGPGGAGGPGGPPPSGMSGMGGPSGASGSAGGSASGSAVAAQATTSGTSGAALLAVVSVPLGVMALVFGLGHI